ncbi:MAPEG family protein [Psychrobacter sp. HD31]|uniref:MAPEG family protein n=1 Tax=Psychrobacter sp. HD31 TaxID=3112003 RepID=UPI003DA2BAEF
MIPNTSSASIGLMALACLLPFAFAIIAKVIAGFKAVDNSNPREFMAKQTGLAARVDAIQKNSFESLPMFLAAMLVAMLFFVPQQIINYLAVLYVGLRVAYGFAYILNWATLRSVLWLLSMACIMMLFYLAAKLAL